MNDTEVYRNAPIALATIEIRHPTTDSLTSSESRELKRLLVDALPIERPGQDSAWAIVPPATTPTQTGERFVRHLNRDGTASATIKTQATIIESTAYTGFEGLAELMLRVSEARNQVAPIIGLERIGLRYVYEIRVPGGMVSGVDWSSWINESALGPQRIAPMGLSLTEWQGAAVYREPQPGKTLVLRYGPAIGRALDPNYHLRQPRATEAGPFFLMDIDSFWTPGGSIPEYNGEALRATLQDLYVPARSIFEDMITARLRDELLHSFS